MKHLHDYRCYKGFTDTVDVDLDISLLEYGIARNPKTSETVFSRNTHKEPETIKDADLFCDIITLDDVKEALNDQEKGFFDFIGSDLKTELQFLDNSFLSHLIQSLNQYNGWFNQY